MEKIKQKIKGMMKQRSMTATYVSLGLVLPLRVSSNWIAAMKTPRANRLRLAPNFFPPLHFPSLEVGAWPTIPECRIYVKEFT